MQRYIQLSNDGSSTVFNEMVNEAYHSKHGALTESKHVFIEKGLMKVLKSHVRILEIGFGTGLNAILAFESAEKQNIQIEYCTIELYPLENQLVEQLNYNQYFEPSIQKVFMELHTCKWNEKIGISKNFVFKKFQENALEVKLSGLFDVVFFDAFSPEKQPELWTIEFFKSIYDKMNSGAVLTTYCAKGIVKRALREIGFVVELLPGPPGKRQMIRAFKS